MSEARLWEWLKPYLPRGQYTRVETGDTGPGFPDVHYQIRDSEGAYGTSGTLELKFSRSRGQIPFTPQTGIRPSQLEWISENWEHGGICFIVARVQREVMVIPGVRVHHINGATRDHLRKISDLILPFGDMKPYDVERLAQLLRNEV